MINITLGSQITQTFALVILSIMLSFILIINSYNETFLLRFSRGTQDGLRSYTLGEDPLQVKRHILVEHLPTNTDQWNPWDKLEWAMDCNSLPSTPTPSPVKYLTSHIFCRNSSSRRLTQNICFGALELLPNLLDFESQNMWLFCRVPPIPLQL